jgi:hypothetical protein
MELTKMIEMLGALEKGIIPPNMDVDAALAELSAEEAHRARRKFRKLWRRHARRSALRWHGREKADTAAKRRWARMECRQVGRRLFEGREP